MAFSSFTRVDIMCSATIFFLSSVSLVNGYSSVFLRPQYKSDLIPCNKAILARRQQRRPAWISVSLAASESDEDLSWMSVPPPDPSETQIAPATSPASFDEYYNDEGDRMDPTDMGDIVIPSTGVSITDELQEAQADKFVTEFVPIKDLPGVAQIVTAASSWSFDPVRYLVALSPPVLKQLSAIEGETEQQPIETRSSNNEANSYVMTDVPPYSDQLVTKMKHFMGPDANLAAIFVTSRDAIHYDEGPAVYTTRKSDLDQWTKAFPDVEIVVYRLDVPRDCRDSVTQRLDGYGPWAWEESNSTFVETGRPLTFMEWDAETAAGIMDKGEAPPDYEEEISDGDVFTPETIRAAEEGKRVLVAYTPGHTFGSVTYIFPETEVCVSGFTIPVEDNRQEENEGVGGAGPALDIRGYISTSKAGMGRQMESARAVIETYGDRFTTVLPARGDPLFLDGNSVDGRKEILLDIVDQYDKIGKLYEDLGITSSDP